MKRLLSSLFVTAIAVVALAFPAPSDACNLGFRSSYRSSFGYGHGAAFTYGYSAPIYQQQFVQYVEPQVQYVAPPAQYVAPQCACAPQQYQQQYQQPAYQPLVQKQYVAQQQTYAYADPQYAAPATAYYQPQIVQVKSYAAPLRFTGGHHVRQVGAPVYGGNIASRAIYGAGNLVRNILGH